MASSLNDASSLALRDVNPVRVASALKEKTSVDSMALTKNNKNNNNNQQTRFLWTESLFLIALEYWHNVLITFVFVNTNGCVCVCGVCVCRSW